MVEKPQDHAEDKTKRERSETLRQPLEREPTSCDTFSPRCFLSTVDVRSSELGSLLSHQASHELRFTHAQKPSNISQIWPLLLPPVSLGRGPKHPKVLNYDKSSSFQ